MRVLRTELVFMMGVLFVCGHVNEVELSGEHSLELTQNLNLGRQELIQEVCARFPPNYTLEELKPMDLEHILVNHEHKLLYCYVPKVACTNWKRILMILSRNTNTSDVLSIPASLAHQPGLFQNLSSVERPLRDFMLDTYHRMIIVRNPFERLLSAYRNKLEGGSQSARYFQDRVGRRIISAFREHPSNESLALGHDVTFKEFALFLTEQVASLANVASNEHWRPISDLCHPCHIKYTLVGKYETLLDDSQLALHTINASHVRFPNVYHTSGTSEKLHKYYSQLDLPLIRRLYKLYENDYRIFDYDIENIVGFDLG